MNPGLPQGFVRLGTNHHRILVLMLELGPLRHRDLMEETGIGSGQVSVALQQLSAAGLIHRHPPARQYDTGDRTQAVWGLHPYRGKLPIHTVRVPHQERQRRYRANRRRRVASVWQYRPAGVGEVRGQA